MATRQDLDHPLRSTTEKETESGVPVVNEEGSMARSLREKRISLALDVLCFRHRFFLGEIVW